ncbi:MAG TPA: hypothetical protein QF753_18410 [Victivallales bacterium]|nr:hypothetical protein [Victivallales bacterium]
MFVEKICTAFLLGLSWERILTCPFFVLGLSLSDRWTGVKFILGRLLGLVCLGTIVSIIGIPFSISEKWMNIIFSLFLFGVATYTLTNNKHKGAGKNIAQASFGLGFFRAILHPGRKIIYLLPLLWGVDVFQGLTISLVYGLSSSVYLLIGFISAEIINKIFIHRKKIKIISAAILIILGIFYLIKAFN